MSEMILSVTENQYCIEQKYRPLTLDECILPSNVYKDIKGLIRKGRIPSILLHSKSPGTGKTTTALAISNEVDAESMFVTGGCLRIANLRNEITDFATTQTTRSGGKVLIIDEGDNPDMKAVHKELRSWMEAFSDNCTVIMTCNNLDAIPDNLRSRFRVVEYGQINCGSEEEDQAEKTRMIKNMIMRCLKICENEGWVVEDKRVIAKVVTDCFPDFRRVLTTLDRYGSNGVIDSGILNTLVSTTRVVDNVIQLLKGRKMVQIRNICPSIATDFGGFITSLYNKGISQVEPSSIRMFIKAISEAQKYANTVPNIEILVFDMLADLAFEVEWK